MIGAATLIGAIQTGTILDQILKIRSQAADITAGVEQLKQGIELLRLQLQQNTASATIGANPILNSNNVSKNEIERALEVIPNSASVAGAAMILPGNKRAYVIDQLHKATNVKERTLILQNSLEYAPALNELKR